MTWLNSNREKRQKNARLQGRKGLRRHIEHPTIKNGGALHPNRMINTLIIIILLTLIALQMEFIFTFLLYLTQEKGPIG